MPNPTSSSAITMTVMRCRRQMPTNWSIIQQDSAAHYDLLARLYSGEQRDLAAFLEQRLDRAPLEGPRRGGDEHRGAIVVHEQRRARHDDALRRRTAQRHG